MSHERQLSLELSHEAFEFDEKEHTYYTITNERLQAIVVDNSTIVSKVESKPRYFGNFLHITLSHNSESRPQSFMFYGLGHHTQLNRWYHQTWFWHPEPLDPNFPKETLSKNSLQQVILRRRQRISPHIEAYTEEKQEELSNLLADLKGDNGNTDIQHKVLNIIDDLSA